jgi:hypothetical protein
MLAMACHPDSKDIIRQCELFILTMYIFDNIVKKAVYIIPYPFVIFLMAAIV